MLGGVNPKQMQAMMKKMGISNEEIPASKVTIEKTDGSKIIINNPSVTKVTMQGQETFQIAGDISEEAGEPEESFSEEDIKTVVEKTGKSKDEAKKALESSNGDLAEAILNLS